MRTSRIVIVALNVFAVIGIILHANPYFIPSSDDKSMLVPIIFFLLLFFINGILLMVFYFLKREALLRFQKRILGLMFLVSLFTIYIYSLL